MSLFSPRTLSVIVAVFLVLSFLPTPDGPALEVGLSKAGVGAVQSAARETLERQRDQALKGFLILSGFKVGLAVLRSSEVGLILNVRIGDLAVAVYDYVNFGWKVLLGALTYFFLAEYFLDFTTAVDLWFARAALLLFLLFLLVGFRYPPGSRMTGLFKRGALVSCVLAVVLYLAVPLAFVGSGWVSSRVTAGTIDDTNQILLETKANLPGMGSAGKADAPAPTRPPSPGTPSVTVPFPYDGTDPSLAVTDNEAGSERISPEGGIPANRSQLRELKQYLEERSKSLASSVIRQAAAYLFDIVLFPFLSIAFVYWGVKSALSGGFRPRFAERGQKPV